MKAHGPEGVPVGSLADPRGFEALLSGYLEWLAVHGYSESSHRQALTVVRGFAGWCAERSIARPAEVTRPVLERYQRWLFHYRKGDERPLSVTTQHGMLSRLKSFYRWLVREGYLLANPASEIVLPKKGVRLPVDGFSVAEAEQVLATPDVATPLGLRDRAILETLYSTGVRRRELVALDLYDVDFERGYLTVRAGKGDKDRVVPIGERALAWVGRWIEEVRGELVATADEWALFLNADGTRFNPDGLGSLVRELIRASGVRPRKGACHLFRHTMATVLLEGGADVRYVQEMLGHAKLETTQIYTRVSIAKLKEIHTAAHPARLERTSTTVAELMGESGGEDDEEDDQVDDEQELDDELDEDEEDALEDLEDALVEDAASGD